MQTGCRPREAITIALSCFIGNLSPHLGNPALEYAHHLNVLTFRLFQIFLIGLPL